MAYEDMTYEVVLQRMINRVSNLYPTLDVREGSEKYLVKAVLIGVVSL